MGEAAEEVARGSSSSSRYVHEDDAEVGWSVGVLVVNFEMREKQLGERRNLVFVNLV